MIYKTFRKYLRLQHFWVNQRYFDNYSFIHINKCGGTSVENYLGILKVHDTAADRIQAIGKDKWDSRYTFALVRNPYARVVSHFSYRTKTNQTNLQNKPITLNNWIERAYGSKDRDLYDNPLMFAPCCNWLKFDNKIAVNHVIKLEEIDDEWKKVCKRLKRNYVPLQTKNATSTNSALKAVELLTKQSIDIINRHFEEDFELFAYKQVSV